MSRPPLALVCRGLVPVTLLLGSIAGCGSLPTAEPYPTPAGLQALPDAAVSAAPAYLIDEGIDLNIPYGSFGIGQSNGFWSLAWQHDQPLRTYSGDLYCPTGCRFLVDVSSMVPPARVELLAANHVRFSVPSQPETHYRLSFTMPEQVLLGLSLQIDGQPAGNPRTVFSSKKQLSSVDTMPFRLVGSLGPILAVGGQ